MLKLALTSMLSLAASFALAFPMEGNVRVTPNNVVVEFCNHTCEYEIYCQARATGILNTGMPITEEGGMYLNPGQCGYAYVYANYPYYFINGNGQADCQ